MAAEDIKLGSEPTGPEAQEILKIARAAGHLPDGFVERELATMRGETADEVRAAGNVHGEVNAGQAEGTDHGKGDKELFQELIWLGQLKTRFDALPKLHEGIQWTDVERSLKADPNSMRKLQALDEKGHSMNVFGEEKGEFIFASGWNDYNKVSLDHRNIAYDLEGQKLAEKQGYHPTGNAVDIATLMGVDLADTKFHEQLRKAIAVNGLAWLKTDAATRATGYAFYGDDSGIYGYDARYLYDRSSLRAALRVKKA